MRRWRRLAAEVVVLLQEISRSHTLRESDIAQQMRRETLERRDPLPVVAARQPSAQAAEPAGVGRPALGKPVDFKSLCHDRPICFQRPRLAYALAMNLRSTLAPFKPILRGRA